MIERAVLHLGMHTTGTTSFQTFLNENRSVLAAQGFVVYSPVSGGINAAELSSAARGLLGADRVDAIKASLERSCSTTGPHTLLASGESLSLLSNENQIRQLLALFPESVGQVDGLLVVRDKQVWLDRINSEQIQRQNALSGDSVGPVTWESQMELYEGAFSNLLLTDYERSNMVEKLCSIIGIDSSGCDTDISYHRTSRLKALLERHAPSMINFYAKHLAHGPIGRAKRRVANRKWF
jgi:hypothetical protein